MVDAPPRAAEAALTPAQREQLKALLAAGATCRATAASPYDRRLTVCNPNVLAVLKHYDLVDNLVDRLGRSHQVTRYWLTLDGADRARALVEAGL